MGPRRLRGRPGAPEAPLAAPPCRGGLEAGGGAPPPAHRSPRALLCLAEGRSSSESCSHQSPAFTALGPVDCTVAPSPCGPPSFRLQDVPSDPERLGQRMAPDDHTAQPCPAGWLHSTRFSDSSSPLPKIPRGRDLWKVLQDAHVMCVCDGENALPSLLFTKDLLQPRAVAPRSPCPRPDPLGGEGVGIV